MEPPLAHTPGRWAPRTILFAAAALAGLSSASVAGIRKRQLAGLHLLGHANGGASATLSQADRGTSNSSALGELKIKFNLGGTLLDQPRSTSTRR